MKLKSIEISNYKSIKKPVKIDLRSGKPTVFTGKNGCGKTNLLEAITVAFYESDYYFDGAKDIKVKFTYKLDKAELDEYFAITEETADKSVDEISVFFDRAYQDIKWAQVPAVQLSVEKYKPRLEKVKAEFEVSSKKYLGIINGFLDEIGYGKFLYFSLDEEKEGHYYDGCNAFKTHLRQAEYHFTKTEEELDNLLNHLKDGVLKFGNGRDDRYFQNYGFHLSFDLPQITAYKFAVDKIETHCLGITEETIKKANAEFEKIVTELNGRLKSEHEEITSQIKEIQEIADEVGKLTRDCDDEYYYAQQELEKRQDTFYGKLKKAMHRKCYLLDNENSMLFFDDGDGRYGRSGKRERNLHSYNPVTDALHNFLEVGGHYEKGESIKNFSKLSDVRKKQIVKILNEKFFKHQKLDFDKGVKYKLEISDGSPELFVIEKNGEKISFNNTSLGRRWYLSYVFVKRLLKKGDYLLIDEPAAFLHPQAQAEFRKEIEELSKMKGITVFYTTHSPNMVSFEETVYGVEMGDNGTEIAKLDFDDKGVKGKLEEVWGSFDFYRELVFNLSDTIILVEGRADKICIEKFAELLGYDLSDYYLHACDGEAILQCFYLLHRSGRKVFMIADNDNKFKSEYHQRQHPNYKTIIEYIETVPESCYFMGDGEDGRLEDLFEDPEHELKIYYKIERKTKISPAKISKINDLTGYEKPAENFDKIFKRFKIPKIKVKK